jgi:hypothetical protein
MAVPLSSKIAHLTPSLGTRALGGTIFGPFLPRVAESQPYKSAQELLAPIKLLPAKVQAPLAADWQSIEGIRSDLLDSAKSLDAEDGSLYDEAVSINAEQAQLQKRIDDFNADVNNYNQQCAGQPVNQPCQDWFARIGAARTQLLSDIANHNARVDNWNARYNALSANAASQNQKVSDWEAAIGRFSANATKALDTAGISTLRLQAQTGFILEASAVTNLPKAISLAQCLETMDSLWSKLSNPQQATRVNARTKVQAWMKGAAAGGGSGPTGRQLAFYDTEPHGTDDPRFDLQVIRGKACVNVVCDIRDGCFAR